MGKIRRGGYVFVTWKGKPNARILSLLAQLEEERLL